MPDYIDIHNLPPGTTPEDIKKAHERDLAVQDKYGVAYHKYWYNESAHKVFCLCHAPSAEAAAQVHREAHGMTADNIIEVQPNVAELFLGGTEVDSAGAAIFAGGAHSERDPGVRTILFTDIVDSTGMTQRIGDDAAMMVLETHDNIVRDALSALGGQEVKHTGDGIMASFPSAASAIKCASRIQSRLNEHSEEAKYPVKVRIGVAAGEPVEHHHDLFGCTVQLAARLCAYAAPQQIVVSNVVAELCIGKGLAFKDLGEVALKGFEQPMRVHAVAWSAQSV